MGAQGSREQHGAPAARRESVWLKSEFVQAIRRGEYLYDPKLARAISRITARLANVSGYVDPEDVEPDSGLPSRSIQGRMADVLYADISDALELMELFITGTTSLRGQYALNFEVLKIHQSEVDEYVQSCSNSKEERAANMDGPGCTLSVEMPASEKVCATPSDDHRLADEKSKGKQSSTSCLGHLLWFSDPRKMKKSSLSRTSLGRVLFTFSWHFKHFSQYLCCGRHKESSKENKETAKKQRPYLPFGIGNTSLSLFIAKMSVISLVASDVVTDVVFMWKDLFPLVGTANSYLFWLSIATYVTIILARAIYGQILLEGRLPLTIYNVMWLYYAAFFDPSNGFRMLSRDVGSRRTIDGGVYGSSNDSVTWDPITWKAHTRLLRNRNMVFTYSLLALKLIMHMAIQARFKHIKEPGITLSLVFSRLTTFGVFIKLVANVHSTWSGSSDLIITRTARHIAFSCQKWADISAVQEFVNNCLKETGSRSSLKSFLALRRDLLTPNAKQTDPDLYPDAHQFLTTTTEEMTLSCFKPELSVALTVRTLDFSGLQGIGAHLGDIFRFCPNLERIELAFTAITDEDLKTWPRFRSLRLERVGLDSCNLLTDKGIADVADAASMSLRSISLRNLPYLSDRSLCVLAERCPNLEEVFLDREKKFFSMSNIGGVNVQHFSVGGLYELASSTRSSLRCLTADYAVKPRPGPGRGPGPGADNIDGVSSSENSQSSVSAHQGEAGDPRFTSFNENSPVADQLDQLVGQLSIWLEELSLAGVDRIGPRFVLALFKRCRFLRSVQLESCLDMKKCTRDVLEPLFTVDKLPNDLEVLCVEDVDWNPEELKNEPLPYLKHIHIGSPVTRVRQIVEYINRNLSELTAFGDSLKEEVEDFVTRLSQCCSGGDAESYRALGLATRMHDLIRLNLQSRDQKDAERWTTVLRSTLETVKRQGITTAALCPSRFPYSHLPPFGLRPLRHINFICSPNLYGAFTASILDNGSPHVSKLIGKVSPMSQLPFNELSFSAYLKLSREFGVPRNAEYFRIAMPAHNFQDADSCLSSFLDTSASSSGLERLVRFGGVLFFDRHSQFLSASYLVPGTTIEFDALESKSAPCHEARLEWNKLTIQSLVPVSTSPATLADIGAQGDIEEAFQGSSSIQIAFFHPVKPGSRKEYGVGFRSVNSNGDTTDTCFFCVADQSSVVANAQAPPQRSQTGKSTSAA